MYSSSCQTDPHFYQNCGHTGCNDYKVVNGNYTMFCGAYVCEDEVLGNIFGGTDQERIYNCNGELECKTTDIDEHYECSGYTDTYRCKDVRGSTINKAKQCDHICDCYFCDDEGYCNNQTTGMFCLSITNVSTYISAHTLCDNDTDCHGNVDEVCPLDDVVGYCKTGEFENTTIKSLYRPLTASMKCSIIGGISREFYLCDDLLDQTNCTDYLKVALKCDRNGYPTTISRHAICKGVPLCDDLYENQCFDMEGSCLVHKSEICDGVSQCNGGSDESKKFCSKMSNVTCTRRMSYEYGENKVRQIPLSWVFDGVIDCVEKTDEITEFWEKCGKNPRFVRYEEKNTICSDVFVCPEMNGFANFDNLCDKIESCAGENEVCKVSRSLIYTKNKVDIVSNKRVVNGIIHNGLNDLRFLMGQKIEIVSFRSIPSDAFGGSKIDIKLPSSEMDCSYMYGEQMVFMSCSGKCINSSCPLLEVKHDVCIDKPLNRRLYSFTPDNKLTILNKVNGTYINNIFPCKNKNCVFFDQVNFLHFKTFLFII